MKQLYVISGMTGMTGSELAGQIIRQARGDIIGFDNFFCSTEEAIAEIRNDPHLRFFPYDLNNSAEMAEIAALVLRVKQNYDRVNYINCAAVVHTEYFYRVNTTFDTNVNGMRSFLQQAILVGADAFINCSTSEVYSMQSFAEGGVRESDYLLLADAEHSQRTSYACGKLMTEFFMKDAADAGQIRGCSIRFANVYSKNELYAKHILPHIVVSLMKDGSVTLLDNSRRNKRTFLHNYDSCAAVLALLDAPDALDGSVYNVATEEEISILDLVKLIAGKLGIAEPVIRFEGHRDSDPERRVLNTEKIRSRTAWRPAVSLSEGIDMLLRYQKEKG